MPGFDGAGPSGRGSMTGRGQGYCITALPLENRFSGLGFGVGRGRRPHGCGLGRCAGGGRSTRGGRNTGPGRRFGGRWQTAQNGGSQSSTGSPDYPGTSGTPDSAGNPNTSGT